MTAHRGVKRRLVRDQSAVKLCTFQPPTGRGLPVPPYSALARAAGGAGAPAHAGGGHVPAARQPPLQGVWKLRP
jgi:hypothetical protein